MQAYEFNATAQNGIIRIPEEYARKIGPEMRVILLPKKDTDSGNKPVRRSLNDLVGVLKDCGDIDLERIRMERLKKYENFD